jgi:two-component system, sensor histidine kinase and response regulator
MVIAIALLALLGWEYNIPVLTSVFSGKVRMNPLTAILFMVSGLALLNAASRRNRIAFCIIPSIIVCVVVSLKLIVFITGWAWNIDGFLFSSSLAGNKMALNSVVNFILTSISVILISGRSERNILAAQLFNLVSFMFSMLSILGYVYSIRTYGGFTQFFPTAINTSISFALLNIGIFLVKEHRGFISVVSARLLGGNLSRRLLPVAILLPMILGYSRFEARRAGIIGEHTSVSVVMIFIILVLSFVIWMYARYLNKIDIERKKTEIELLHAKNTAELAKKTQEQFLAMMSHEIRTPMNGVIGMTSLLQNTTLSEEQKSFVDTIRVSGESLLVIINDILDFSKIQEGRLELEEMPLSIRNVIEETFDLLALEAGQKKLELRFDISNDVPDVILGDVTRLRQVLVNLVSNGIKFTDGGDIQVFVSLKGFREEFFEIEFKVQDTGIGIPPDKLDRLFIAFSQTDASNSRKYGGTGLGLAISARLVQMMGGDIGVDSEAGKGSEFHFTILAKKALKADPFISPIPAVSPNDYNIFENKNISSAGISILVAEDNMINQKIVLQMLKKIGYQADLAANGLEVLEAVQRQHYDFILMDMIMPELDGLQTTQKIRELDAIRQPVVVALTANAMQGERERCIAAGMNDYLSKPFKIKDLETLINRWFGDPQPINPIPEMI